MATKIGEAYIDLSADADQLVRDLAGVGRSVEGVLSDSLTDAGSAAGSAMASALSDSAEQGIGRAAPAISGGIEDALSSEMQAAGASAGAALSDSLGQEGARGGAAAGAATGDALSDALATEAASGGRAAADSAADAVQGRSGQFSKLGSLLANSLSVAFGIGLAKLADAVSTAVGWVMKPIEIAIESGIGRLTSMDTAEARFRGLGIQGRELQSVMESANKAVTDTRYGLSEAANAAGLLMISGVESGKELDLILSGITTTAAATGREYEEVAAIFQTLVTNGKLGGREMQMLQESGVNALAAIADHYGITDEAAQAMYENGEIGAAEFAEVMNGTMGDMASEMASTLEGMGTNLRARLGKMFEGAAEPFYDGLKTVLEPLIALVGEIASALQPIWDALGDRIAPMFESWADAIAGIDVGKVEAFADSLARVISGDMSFDDLIDGISEVSPLIGGMLSSISDNWGDIEPLLGEMQQLFQDVGREIADALLPVLPKLVDAAMELAPELVKLIDPLADILVAVLPLIGPLTDLAVAVLPPLIDGFIWLVDHALAPLVEIFAGNLGSRVQALADLFSGDMQSAIENLITPFEDFLDLIGVELPGQFGNAEGMAEGWANSLDLMGEHIRALSEGDLVGLSDVLIGVIDHFEAWTGMEFPIFDTIREAIENFQPTLETLQENLGIFFEDWATTWEDVKTTFSDAWNEIVGIASTVWGIITTIFDTAGQVIQQLVAGAILFILNLFEGDFAGAAEIVSTVWEDIKDIFSNAGDDISDEVSRLVDRVVGFFRDMMGRVTSTVSDGIDDVVNFFRRLPGRVISAVSRLKGRMVSIGRGIIDGMIEGITGAIGGAITAVQTAVGSVIDGAKSVLGINSPSRVFRDEVGKSIPEGLALGIDQGSGQALRSVQTLAYALARRAQMGDLGGDGMISTLNGALTGRPRAQVSSTAATAASSNGQPTTFTIVDKNGAVVMQLEAQVDEKLKAGTRGNLRSELGVSR